MKKGRHRRFEEARSLKRAVEVVAEPCPECGADPEDDHASWCLYEAAELDEDEAEGEDEAGDAEAGDPGPGARLNGNGSGAERRA